MLSIKRLSAGCLFSLALQASSVAQVNCDTGQAASSVCDTAMCDSAGCDALPGENYGISGDWLGLRPRLDERGIAFEGDVTQFYQGVAHGGVREAFNYAGHGDYVVKFDFEKLMDLNGWSLLTRAEHRWGQGVGRDAGVLLPPALHAVTPSLESEDVIITNFLFTNVVNDNVTTFFGKLDTLDGDRNPLASGRGKRGFMNTSLLLPVGGLPTVPLATLGGGAVFFVDGLPLGQIMVLNATDTVETSGFEELFAEGAVLLGSVNAPLPIGGKTGVHTFSYGWSSRDFVALNQDPRILLPSVPLAETSDSWIAWWSGAQYLQEDPNTPLKGWGLFGRAGAADPEVNPIALFFNAGIGGNSPLAGRDRDLFGIGWFYNRFSDRLGPIATTALDLQDYSTGIETYYNFAATNSLWITPDLQVLEPGSNRANTALLAGLRVELDF